MCNNNFGGGNICWIIVLILLLCNCGCFGVYGSYINISGCCYNIRCGCC